MTHPDDLEILPPELLTFYCPFKAEVSAEADTLFQGSLAWAQQFGLDSDGHAAMMAMAGAGYTAHAIPHAKGEVAQALADYNTWAWTVNDYVTSGDQLGTIITSLGRWERIIRSPRSWPDATRPLDAAAADVFQRLRCLLTPVQWERFSAGQSHWIQSMGWEAAHLETDRPVSVNDYLAMRIGYVGVYSAAAFLDAVEDIELSEQQWARPTVRAAAESSMLAAALDNDRYSYPRERRHPIRKPNLFDAIRHERPQLTVAQALLEGVTIRDRILTLYVRLREDILRDADDGLHSYITGLDRIVSGNVNMATAASRYLLADFPHKIITTAHPADVSTAPLRIPTIAWWWEHDTST